MDKDVHFVFDEEWEDQEKELQQILHEVDSPKLHKNVFVLRSIIRGCAYAFVKKIEKERILGEEAKKPKYYQKLMNILEGTEIYPVPIPSTESKIQPAYTYKEVPRYTQKLVIESEEKKEKQKISLPVEENKKDLIIDNITGKVLASAEINENYLVKEPELDEQDIKVLNKVVKKKIKNMENGWKLIQKYGKKFKIKPGHDTLIKYYVVNDVFGLGKVEPLLHDKDISSIACEGVDKPLIAGVDADKLTTNIKFNKEDLFNFLHGMARKMNQKLNKKHTSVKGQLRGFEFNLSIGEEDNPSFTAKRI